MKNPRRVFILVLLLFSSMFTSYGQKSRLDSICVQIDDQVKINMAIYDYQDLGEQVKKDLKSLQTILKGGKDIPEEGSYSIAYETNKLLSIKPNAPGERIIWENGKRARCQLNNQCYIHSDNYDLQIQFNEFEKLISDSLINQLEKVIDNTNTIQSRFASTYNYSFQGEELLHNMQLDKINGQLDALSFKGGVGLNFIKNQPVMDLSAEMGLMLSKKGIWKNQYYLSYNQLSDFVADSKVNLNGFVNVGYRYNLSNSVKTSNWLGVEFGYLAISHGDMFEKNTFKFGVNWDIGKYISVTPQLYFSDHFSYPAVRIGFGF